MDVLGSFLDERSCHRTTGAPEAVVDDLLQELGRRFYQGKAVKVWMQDQKPLLLALTWPAGWLQQRGVSLPVARYGEILREVISGIATHGDLAKIDHFPSYLLHCVRLWFVHHGEELYYRQKSIRDAIDLDLLKRGSARPVPAADPIETLAAAHRVLATRKRPAKTRPVDTAQTTFF